MVVGRLRYNMVQSVSFKPPMQSQKSNGFKLVKYCIKVWCEVDCQLTTVWQILEIKQDGKLLPNLLLLSFLQMSFFREFFLWFIVTIKFKCTNQTLSEQNLLKRGIWHNFYSIFTAKEEEIKVMQWVLLSFEANVMTFKFNSCSKAIVTNQSTINTWYLTFPQLKKLHISISTN